MPEKKHLVAAWKLLVLAMIIAGIWAFFRFLFPLLSPFLLALLLAHLLEPAVKRLQKQFRLPRHLGSGLLTVLVIGGLAAALVFLGVWIVSEVSGLTKNLPAWISRLPELTDSWQATISGWIQAAPVTMQEFLQSTFDKMIRDGITIPTELYTWLASWVSSLAGALPGVVLFWAAAVLSTYFISRDYPRLTDWISRTLPAHIREKTFRAKNHIGSSIGKWMKAQGIMMCLTFAELTVGLLVLRVPYAIFIAAVTAILDALPVVGIGLVLLPWALFSFISGSKWLGLGLLILYAVVNLVRSLLEPKLVGRQLGLHPIVTLAAMYIGFRTAGVLGMVLFPILSITLKQMYEWGWLSFFIPGRKSEDAGSDAAGHTE